MISHPPSSELLGSSQGKCDHSQCAMVEFYRGMCDHSQCAMVEFYRGKCDHSLCAMVEFYLQMLMIAVSFFIVSDSSQKADFIERLPPTVQVMWNSIFCSDHVECRKSLEEPREGRGKRGERRRERGKGEKEKGEGEKKKKNRRGKRTKRGERRARRKSACQYLKGPASKTDRVQFSLINSTG